MTDEPQSSADSAEPIYQCMDTGDDEGAGKDVWLDVTHQAFAEMQKRPGIRSRVVYAEPQTALMVLARNALQAARDALRPYAKIDYDVDNQPQPNNAFDVDQICREALYEIDVAEPIIRCADCPSRYLNGGCSGCPEDAPLAVERSQAVSAPSDLADAINAGIKACDLYEVAKEDVLRRSHLEQFLTAAMAALTRPERKP